MSAKLDAVVMWSSVALVPISFVNMVLGFVFVGVSCGLMLSVLLGLVTVYAVMSVKIRQELTSWGDL